MAIGVKTSDEAAALLYTRLREAEHPVSPSLTYDQQGREVAANSPQAYGHSRLTAGETAELKGVVTQILDALPASERGMFMLRVNQELQTRTSSGMASSGEAGFLRQLQEHLNKEYDSRSDRVDGVKTGKDAFLVLRGKLTRVTKNEARQAVDKDGKPVAADRAYGHQQLLPDETKQVKALVARLLESLPSVEEKRAFLRSAYDEFKAVADYGAGATDKQTLNELMGSLRAAFPQEMTEAAGVKTHKR